MYDRIDRLFTGHSCIDDLVVCVQENEAVQEEKKKQLYEEGIDAILARAEVVQDTKAEMAERNDELLSSFNVATFKSDEDDQAFWNRLIPVDQRPTKQPEVPENLGLRTARLTKFAEDVSCTFSLCFSCPQMFMHESNICSSRCLVKG